MTRPDGPWGLTRPKACKESGTVSDDTPAASKPRTSRATHAADTAEVGPAETAVVEAPLSGPGAETAAADASSPPVQTVFVHAPLAPKKRGNRGIGSLIAVISTVIFGVLYAVGISIIGAVQGRAFQLDYLTTSLYIVPVAFFLVGFVLLVLVVNRANWWAFILGSLFVGAFVYFGTVGMVLLLDNVVGKTPSEASHLFGQGLISPYVILAALLAREVSMWMGSAVSARGRRLKVRNAEARAAHEQQVAEQRAEYERVVKPSA